MDYLKVQEPILPLLRSTEKVLARQLRSKVSLISELRQHTPVGKGKKIRAAFFFLLAGMNRVGADGLPQMAAAIEMLHLSSLVHDDIVDNSAWRRGEKTTNHHFGNYLSLLWGDFLFITSLCMLSAQNRSRIMDMMLDASRQMIEGQILEFANNFNYCIRSRTYYDIIRKKTSSMFAGIASLAAQLNEKPARAAADFYRFGQDFGMIFQISDDLLDIFSDSAGKSRFQDLQEGKVTLPYILLLRHDALPLIKNFHRSRPQSLLERCRTLGIKEQSLQIIDRYYRKCTSFLESFPPSAHRESMANLLEFIRYRDY
ncbi:MAG: polyprenyl synthetase family protein [Acidobacteria bacterium]|nr:polyprenyl synthetase family protein [Acidobacteriota bacterium]MBU4307643.1 polyprenyl synthetase family protein [Acidobacteriota bacterium]MBU4404385.1 polyprenyl synthetase family protein [Acidobacteriota bacterium]MCG2810447.1 polyprenyl synthetase family protein [Candidatus Aminicenantes bacterium]